MDVRKGEKASSFQLLASKLFVRDEKPIAALIAF
jgi:hypothetical protein